MGACMGRGLDGLRPRLGLGLGRLIVMRLIGLRLVKARILRLGGSGRLLAGRNRLLLEGRRLRCRLSLIS